jgi:hypothetical protein
MEDVFGAGVFHSAFVMAEGVKADFHYSLILKLCCDISPNVSYLVLNLARAQP